MIDNDDLIQAKTQTIATIEQAQGRQSFQYREARFQLATLLTNKRAREEGSASDLKAAFELFTELDHEIAQESDYDSFKFDLANQIAILHLAFGRLDDGFRAFDRADALLQGASRPGSKNRPNRVSISGISGSTVLSPLEEAALSLRTCFSFSVCNAAVVSNFFRIAALLGKSGLHQEAALFRERANIYAKRLFTASLDRAVEDCLALVRYLRSDGLANDALWSLNTLLELRSDLEAPARQELEQCRSALTQ